MKDRLARVWGEGGVEELVSLSRERSSELFYEGLYGYARRLEQAGRMTPALQVYGYLRQVEGSLVWGRRARERLDALEGRGAILPRLEVFGRQLAEQASDPAMIVGMGVAGIGFKATRLLTLSRLAVSPGVFGGGLGARIVAGVAGTLVEAPLFTAAVRGANHLLGREQDWSGGGIWREFASGAVTLVGLKVAGGLTGLGLGRMNGGMRSVRRLRGLANAALPAVGTYAGILGSHVLEERLGLREVRPGSSVWLESLGTYVNLAVGGRLAQEVMGVGFRRMEEGLERRGEAIVGAHPVPQPMQEGRLERIRAGMREALLAPMWMVMGAGGVGGGGRGPRRKIKATQEGAVDSVQAREPMEVRLDFEPSERMTEEEIGRVVKAIVAQDGELYPEGDVSPLSASKKFILRRYRVGSEELSLQTLIGRVRQARRAKSGDTQDLGMAEIVAGWKRELFGWKAPVIERAEARPITLDFTPSERMTEEEIGRVVKAIVAQDGELYPEGDVSPLSTSETFIRRRYRVGGEELSLLSLMYRVRQAKRNKTDDTQVLGYAAIVEGWKRELFGWEAPAVERAEARPITLDFTPSERMTEEEIGRVVKAIVAQDGELYPKGNVSSLSTSEKFTRRCYRVGSEELSLLSLMYRVRQAKRNKTDDTQVLGYAAIVEGWKRELFGWEAPAVERAEARPITLDFTPSERMTEEEIGRVVKAIVTQDGELYPGGDVSPLSTSKKFIRRRYRVGSEELSLQTLIRRVRQARGKKVGDIQGLRNAAIIECWKRELFGWEVIERAEARPITLDFTPSERMTEEEIGRVVKAIVSQDGELYPKGDVSPLSTSETFIRRRYRVGSEELSLNTLIGRFRRARREKPGDTQDLGNAAIIAEWKRELFRWEAPEGQGIPISLDFEPSESMTEEEIGGVVKAIVAQDRELYPRGDVSPLSASKKFILRRYRVGSEELSLDTLIRRFRQAKRNKPGDTQDLGNAAIIAEWKRRIWGIEDYSRYDSAQIETLVGQEGLRGVFELFFLEPSALAEAVEFLSPHLFKNQSAAELIQRYVGLEVESGRRPSGGGVRHDAWRHRSYVQMIAEAIQAGRQLEFSEENLRRQVGLMLRLSRRDFEANPQALLSDLESMAESANHDFLRRLNQETARYYRELLGFELRGMRHAGFAYQREGARFLATHLQGILADEAGMGKSFQAIAAAESLGLRRILWVTTASNKEAVREEILSHSEVSLDQIQVVISGNPRERRRQIARLNGERYRITNYETLRELKERDPASYQRLTAGLDAVIVDEAQLTDNPEALRSQAVHEIAAPRRWLLTATPYQSRPENLYTLLHWLDRQRYGSETAFRELYLESSEGLRRLHRELGEYLLRRSRREVLRYFEPAQQRSFAEQLSDGLPRIPNKVRISPEVSGGYELSAEQMETIAWMTGDFRGWAEAYNERHPESAIDLEGINPLQKFQYIHRAIYLPESLGMEGENPLYEALDRRVEERVSRGEKVILWAWNTEVLDRLEERYGSHGVRRIDGEVVGAARDRARHEFQEDPRVRVLVSNYLSGGVGLTLTAGDADIFVQLPLSYPALYQAEGRNQRLIGLQNVRHAKERVESEWLVPRYTEEFIESIEERELGEVLRLGSLVEQTRRRLEGGERLYQLVMEGMGSLEEFEREFQAGLIRGMGLDRGEGLSFDAGRRQRARRIAQSAEALLPLYERTQGEHRARGLGLISAFQYQEELARDYGRLFGELREIRGEDLEALEGVFGIGNKALREEVLRRLVEVWRRRDAQGLGITEGGVNPLRVVEAIYRVEGSSNEAVLRSLVELSREEGSARQDYLAEHLMRGVLNLGGDEGVGQLLSGREALFAGAPLVERVQLIYRLGLMAKIQPKVLERLGRASFDTWAGLREAVRVGTHEVLSELSGASLKEIEASLGNGEWRGNLDPLLALWVGYEGMGNGSGARLRAKYREALGAIFSGRYREWRRSNGAENLSYLGDQAGFWEGWERGERREITRGESGVLEERIEEAIRDLMGHLPQVPRPLQEYRALNPEEQRLRIGQWQEDQRVLGLLFSRGERTVATEEALARHGLRLESEGPRDQLRIREAMEGIRESLDWIEIEAGGERRIEALGRRMEQYRRSGNEEVVEGLQRLRRQLARATPASRGRLTIEDSDDPAILVRMGSMHPELRNCFNYNGSAVFNQYVTTALGTRSMRMLVVREGGRIVSLAMAKVKRMEDGRPVLYLERGISREGEDYRGEMLEHLRRIAERMDPRPVVMEQIEGSIREGDPEVHGIGAYTPLEYVEPVFGLRSALHARYRGRVRE